jgi:hypothetical protein
MMFSGAEVTGARVRCSPSGYALSGYKEKVPLGDGHGCPHAASVAPLTQVGRDIIAATECRHGVRLGCRS